MIVRDNDALSNFSIFSYGFRPFFLAAGVYAILPLLPWLLYLFGFLQSNISLQIWHSHEMFFGFVAAGISGFLLSALPNWTNTSPLTGNGLKLFFSFWVIGRIVFWLFLFFDHPVFGYLLFLDLLLPIAQLINACNILISTKNNRNYIFIGILMAFACANLFVILEMNELSGLTPGVAALFAPNIIMITIAVIGGRVVPNFTRNYLKQRKSSFEIGKFPMIEKPALILLVLNALIDLVLPHSALSYAIAMLACVAHFIRFRRWGSFHVLNSPIIWVLHMAYFLMIVALFLKGLEGVINLPFHLYLHVFTVGSIGLFMIGIMSRAALGHTGRPLVVRPVIAYAYALVLLGVWFRVVAPFFPDFSTIGMGLSIALWIASYLIFLIVYIPILIRPRVDGKPG